MLLAARLHLPYSDYLKIPLDQIDYMVEQVMEAVESEKELTRK